MWLEYIDKGNAIPVPFNLLYYIFYFCFSPIFLVKWLVRGDCRCNCNKKVNVGNWHFDFGILAKSS